MNYVSAEEGGRRERVFRGLVNPANLQGCDEGIKHKDTHIGTALSNCWNKFR